MCIRDSSHYLYILLGHWQLFYLAALIEWQVEDVYKRQVLLIGESFKWTLFCYPFLTGRLFLYLRVLYYEYFEKSIHQEGSASRKRTNRNS